MGKNSSNCSRMRKTRFENRCLIKQGKTEQGLYTEKRKLGGKTTSKKGPCGF